MILEKRRVPASIDAPIQQLTLALVALCPIAGSTNVHLGMLCLYITWFLCTQHLYRTPTTTRPTTTNIWGVVRVVSREQHHRLATQLHTATACEVLARRIVHNASPDRLQSLMSTRFRHREWDGDPSNLSSALELAIDQHCTIFLSSSEAQHGWFIQHEFTFGTVLTAVSSYSGELAMDWYLNTHLVYLAHY